MKLKEIFNYRKLWKHQRNKNKRLTKKVNKMAKGISEDLKIDITNEEIRKLRLEVNRLKKQVIKYNLEAQKYFDMLMDCYYTKEDKTTKTLLKPSSSSQYIDVKKVLDEIRTKEKREFNRKTKGENEK